jgi:plastocyanin
VKRALAVLVLAAGAALLPALPAHAACDVTVQLSGYAPATKTVAASTTVTWCWNESNHSITFTGGPDSGVRAKDSTYVRTFTAAGTYAYHCSVHGSMQGSVTVPGTTPSPTHTTAPPTHSPTPVRTTAPPTRTPSPTRTTTPPATTPPPTTRPPTTPPATTAPATTTAPTTPAPIDPLPTTPASTPLAGLDVPAKPKTGLALVAGLAVAVAALGGAGWLLLRGRTP